MRGKKITKEKCLILEKFTTLSLIIFSSTHQIMDKVENM